MIELSIVMPCLNEALTLPACIEMAQRFLSSSGIEGEIVIADNGSTDGSPEIARSLGARVVEVAEKGYGNALIEGINGAKGKYVVMGDADESYDFSSLSEFVRNLRQGDDLVMGNRFRGGIEQGAMPALHRYIGNPVLSFIGRLFYSTSIGDFHAGLRAFNRERVQSLGLSCGGMEFASEMVVKAVLNDYRLSEVPIRLYKDGRDRPPHLNSWQDGWRHLRFLLIFSPKWLFIYPGVLLFLIGFVGMATLFPGPVSVGAVVFDIHTMLYCCASLVLGLQMLYLGITARLVGKSFNVLAPGFRGKALIQQLTLERGLVMGVLATVLGLIWSIGAVIQWGEKDFLGLDPTVTMRGIIPAVTLLIAGAQTIISTFFLGVFEMYQEKHKG